MKQMRRAASLLLTAVLICTLTAPALAGNMFLNISTFTNHENASFVNNGTFENNGAVINSGSFNNNKVFRGTGSLHIGSKGRYENGENASFSLDSVTADDGATATGISVNSAAYQVTVIKEGGWPYYILSTPASMADQKFSIEIYGTSEASFRTGGFSPGILMPFGEVGAGTYTWARIWKGTAFDSASLVAENIKLDKPVTVTMDVGDFPLSNLPTVTRMRGTDSNGNSYWEYALQSSESTFGHYTYCLVWGENGKKNYMNLGKSNRGTRPGTEAYMFEQVTLRAAKVTDADTGLTLELSKESKDITVVDSTTTSGYSVTFDTSMSPRLMLSLNTPNGETTYNVTVSNNSSTSSSGTYTMNGLITGTDGKVSFNTPHNAGTYNYATVYTGWDNSLVWSGALTGGTLTVEDGSALDMSGMSVTKNASTTSDNVTTYSYTLSGITDTSFAYSLRCMNNDSTYDIRPITVSGNSGSTGYSNRNYSSCTPIAESYTYDATSSGYTVTRHTGGSTLSFADASSGSNTSSIAAYAIGIDST